jgi:transposase
MGGMKLPLFVRSLTPDEINQLRAGLRSGQAFTVRRCQILLASSRGERASQVARSLGCATQTVRNSLRDFQSRGLDCLEPQSRRPKTVGPVLDASKREQLRALLHTSPRHCGKPTSLWTLGLAAEVMYEQGLTTQRLSREAIRQAIQRLGVKWKRAKRWISSPDPQYALKKSSSKG